MIEGLAEQIATSEDDAAPRATSAAQGVTRLSMTTREISGGTMSTAGRAARDAPPRLMKTCSKQQISFFRSLGDRLGTPAPGPPVPPLSSLVRQSAPA